MCFTRKLVFTVCAHYTVQLVECEKFHNNPDKTGRHACISPLCQHSQSLVTILGFCGACKDAYTGLKVAKINASQILWNFWCFKAAQKWNCAVDPSRVPVAALTSPAKTLHKSWFGYVRTYKEVSLDMIMAVSVQSLLDAFGQPVRATLCTMCRANHYMDLNRIAVGMAEATISWAHGLGYPEAVFESYQTHHHHSTEEVGIAAASGDQLPTTRHQPPVQQARQKQPAMSSVSDNKVIPRRSPAGDPARHTKRLNAKARRDAVIQERGDMLETLEAGHDGRMAELQARVDLNDRRVSPDTWMMRTFGAPDPHSPSRSADQNTNNRSGTSRVLFSQTSPYSSPSGGEFEGFSGAWEHEQDDAQANNNPKPSWPVRRANKRLRYPAHTNDNVIGEYDDALFEQLQARRSQYGEIVDPDDMSLDEGPDPGARFSFVPSPPSHFVGEVRRVRRDTDDLADGQGQSTSDDMVDEHIDFYLDDDSVSVTGRVRPLTYVSPESSRDGSNTSSPRPPSPLSPRHNAAALPGIPPVSPLTFSSEFSFMADRADRSGTSSYRKSLPSDTSHSGRSTDTAGPALKGGLGEDTFGPLSRKSSGVAPLLGPEIRGVAPPRPPRNPKLCVTHGAATQTGCRGCQAGALQEVALRPGTRVKQLEPEQF